MQADPYEQASKSKCYVPNTKFIYLNDKEYSKPILNCNKPTVLHTT